MSIQYHVSHVRDSEGINHGSSDFGIRAQRANLRMDFLDWIQKIK